MPVMHDPSATPTPKPEAAGAPRMADLVAAADWASSPLGPKEAWPQSLRTAVDIMLASGHAMQLAWGPERTVLYNDAYAPMLGDRHPRALGLPFREAWPDVWAEIEPLVERVFAGETVRFPALPLVMTRHGCAEETWWDFSYSPVRDESGAIAGLLNVTVDATGRVRAERAEHERDESRRLQAAMLEVLPIGLAVIGPDGRVRMSNPAWDRFTPGGRTPSRDAERGWRWRAWDGRGGTIAPNDFPGARALRGERCVPGTEFLYTEESGAEVWTNVASVPLFDPQDRVTGAVSIIVDVDASKRALEALREGEERQAFLLKLSDALRPLGSAEEIKVTACELLGRHLRAARVAYYDILDQGRRFVATGSYADGVAPLVEGKPADFGEVFLRKLRADRLMVSNDIRLDPRFTADECLHLVSTGIASFVVVLIERDERWTASFAVHHPEPRDWEQGEVELLRDVAERVHEAAQRARAEGDLRRSEERYRSLFETMGQGYCELALVRDGDGRAIDQHYLEFNPAFERMFAIPIAEARGRLASEVFPSLDPWWTKAFERVAASGRSECLEHRFATADRWFEVFVYPRGGDRLTVLYEDVSERKRDQDAVRDSEARFRAFVTASSDVVYRMSADWSEMRQLDGRGILTDTVTPTGSWMEHYIAPGDRPLVTQAIARAIASKSLFELEHRVRQADGSLGWTLSRAVPILDEAGEISEWLGAASDVTARKRAEEAFVAAESRQRALLEGIPQLVWSAIERGEWTWSSPQWRAYTGLSESESLGQGWLAALHPDDRQAARIFWQAAEDAGSLEMDGRLYHAVDGTYRWFQSRATPVRDETGRIVEWLGTSTDVDDLRQMQERQGVLVAELQHRTRNLMSVVRSLTEKTLSRSVDLADFRDRFGNRLAALARVQGLLSRLDEWDRVTFDELLRSELAVLDGEASRIALDGPEGVALRSSTVQILALALHELMTNAVKYGALAQPRGRLAITWTLEHTPEDGRPWLHVDWRESGVRMPVPGAAAQGGGAGRELIERALPYQLRARTTYVMGEDGVHCTIALAASERQPTREVRDA